MYRKIYEEVFVSKNRFFILCLAVLMTLACAAAVSAQWDGYYCTSGNCGINYYNYNYGFNTGYYCSAIYKGQSFQKTWRIRNTGTVTWTTRMALVFTGGDQMGAAPCVYLPYNVSPGYYVDITVPMTAPSIPTNTKGEWMLRTPDGTLFGVGCNGQTPVWVNINTMNVNASCACYNPAGCTTPCVINAASNTVTRPGRNPYCNNKIRTVRDVTIPDGTVIAPGATFRKTWSMKNGGTCVWDENYVLAFVAGDDMGDGTIVPVTSSVQPSAKYTVNRPATKIYPGDYVQISIDLKAPDKPGTYEAYYRLRDNLGYEFGFGSYADEAFWVRIVVKEDGSATSSVESVSSVDPATVPDAAPIVLDPAAVTEVSSETESDPVEEAVVEEVPSADEITEEEAAAADPALIEKGQTANKCGEQSISMRATETGYEVLWTAVNAGTGTWENFNLVKSDANPAVTLAADTIPVPTTAPGGVAEVTFSIDLGILHGFRQRRLLRVLFRGPCQITRSAQRTVMNTKTRAALPGFLSVFPRRGSALRCCIRSRRSREPGRSWPGRPGGRSASFLSGAALRSACAGPSRSVRSPAA